MDSSKKLYFVDFLVPLGANVPMSDAFIFIEGAEIKQIGKQINLPEELSCFDPVKITNSLVLPGFINSHVHLAYENSYSQVLKNGQIEWIEDLVSDSRGQSLEQKVNIAKTNVQKCIKSGSTFLVENTPFEETIKAIDDSGINSLIGIEVFSNNPSRAEEDFQNHLKKIEVLSKKYKEQTFTFSPHSIYNSSSAILRLINSWAQENQQKVLIHLAETDFESDLFKTGQASPKLKNFYQSLGVNPPSLTDYVGLSPVEYMASIGCLNESWHLTHLVKATVKDLQLISGAFSSVSICLRSNVYLANGFPQLGKIIDLKLPISFATDGLSSNFDLSLLKEIKTAWFIAKSKGVDISAKYLFESITSVPAKAFCPDRGSLEANKKADFLVYSPQQNEFETLNEDNADIYQQLLTNLSDEKLHKVYVDGREIYSF